jgi:hypothetical protein
MPRDFYPDLKDSGFTTAVSEPYVTCRSCFNGIIYEPTDGPVIEGTYYNGLNATYQWRTTFYWPTIPGVVPCYEPSGIPGIVPFYRPNGVLGFYPDL